MAKSAKSSGKDRPMGSKASKLPVGEIPPSQSRSKDVTALGLQPEPFDEEIAEYFEKCEEKIGFVPNVLIAYSHNMAKLKAFIGLYNDVMLAPSGISKLEREMIAVTVSSINKCFYCLVAHGAAVRQLSGDPLLGETIVMNWRSAKLSPRHTAMLEFASKLTESPHLIDEGDRGKLGQVGFTGKDIWDIAATVGFFNMSNRIAAATDMRPNDAYHEQSR